MQSETNYKSFLTQVKPIGKLNREKKEITAIELILEVLKANKKPDDNEIKSARYLHYLASLIENSGKVLWKSKTKVNKLEMLYEIISRVIERPLDETEKNIIKEQVEFLIELKVVKVTSMMKLALNNILIFLQKNLL